MKREDYIMRVVEQMSGFVTYILGLAKSQQHEEAHEVINQATGELLGLSTGSVVELSDEDLVEILQFYQPPGWQYSGVTWEEKCLFLVTLLKHDGDLYQAQGYKNESRERYLKALQLLLKVTMYRSDVVPSDYVPTVAEILAELNTYILPPQINETLLRYYEQRGEFDKAEDVLFDWIGADSMVVETAAIDPIESGIAFYNRLTQKSDQELNVGNLPREEVQDGLAELVSYRSI